MNWVIGKKQKRRNRIKAQFGKNPMELEAWESLEKRMREICADQSYPDVYGRADSVPSPAQYADTAVL